MKKSGIEILPFGIFAGISFVGGPGKGYVVWQLRGFSIQDG